MSLSIKGELLAQSKIVKQCANHIKKKIKNEQKILENEKAEAFHYGMFEDCGQFYQDQVTERRARISALIEQKISLEKFSKKLRYQAEEV